LDMDASAIVTAMLSGGVDACATWSPNSLKILEEMADATKLTDNMSFKDTTVSLASWIVMPSYAEENKDILVRFTKALFKAMDYAADENYEEVAEYVAAQVAQDYDSVFAQRGDADWLTGKEVSEGAANGQVDCSGSGGLRYAGCYGGSGQIKSVTVHSVPVTGKNPCKICFANGFLLEQ